MTCTVFLQAQILELAATVEELKHQLRDYELECDDLEEKLCRQRVCRFFRYFSRPPPSESCAALHVHLQLNCEGLAARNELLCEELDRGSPSLRRLPFLFLASFFAGFVYVECGTFMFLPQAGVSLRAPWSPARSDCTSCPGRKCPARCTRMTAPGPHPVTLKFNRARRGMEDRNCK